MQISEFIRDWEKIDIPDFDTMLGVGDGASVDFIKLFRAKNENSKCSA